MSWIGWISSSSILFAALVTLGLFLKRPVQDALAATVVAKVSSHFDSRLEELRAELSIRERKVQAQLEADQTELEALRNGALSSLNSRNSLLFQKKVETVEKIWGAVIDLRKLLPIAQIIAMIKFEAAADGTKRDPNTRKFFEEVFRPFNTKTTDGFNGSLCRPFLSERAWVYFECYQLILFDAVMQMTIIKSGASADYYNSDGTVKTVKARLPEYTSFLDAHKSMGLYFLISPLEEHLLRELRSMLSGRTDDQNTVVDASEILMASSRAQQFIKSPEEARTFEKIPPEFRRTFT